VEQNTDGYKLNRQIGAGLAGPLWSADSPSGEKVAIRRFASAAPQGSEDWLAARGHFLQAARQAATLKQARVAQVLEVIDEGSEAWAVMEFLPGETLAAVIAKERIPPQQANFMLRLMALTLDHAHQSGVVHGDFKPSNIFVGEKRSIRITDFAISPRARRNLRGAMPSAWVHGYLSPEHLLAPATIGPRSDQYALAAIAYHLYTGHAPFEQPGGDAGPAILRGILPPASSLNRSLSPGIDAVISRAMARDPGQRYSSCTALIEELETGMAPVAPPVTEKKQSSSAKLLYAGMGSLALALIAAAMLLRSGTKQEPAKTVTIPGTQLATAPPPTAPTNPPKEAQQQKRSPMSPQSGNSSRPPGPSGNTVIRERAAVPARANPVERSQESARTVVLPKTIPVNQTPLSPAPSAQVPIPIYGPDVPKGLSLVAYSRQKTIGSGISFSQKDPTLGEMGAGDLKVEVRANGPLGKGVLSIEWQIDGTVAWATQVRPGGTYEYRNEPSPGTYKITLRQDVSKVAEYTFRITP
jgi:serine/threonine protein kinase